MNIPAVKWYCKSPCHSFNNKSTNWFCQIYNFINFFSTRLTHQKCKNNIYHFNNSDVGFYDKWWLSFWLIFQISRMYMNCAKLEPISGKEHKRRCVNPVSRKMIYGVKEIFCLLANFFVFYKKKSLYIF